MRQFAAIVFLTLSLTLAGEAMPLASFSAVGQTRQVLIRWELGSPQPVLGFILTRNGLTAAKVLPQESALAYEWSDREVQNDREYSYSLIAVLADGRQETWGTVFATPSFDAALVREFRLHQNYPNPFNPETTIEIELAEDGQAELTVFDILGQQVAKPFSGDFTRGRYSVLFNGRELPSGVYFYQLQAGSFVDQKKMVLLK